MKIKGNQAFSLCGSTRAIQISVSDLQTNQQEVHKDVFKPVNIMRPDRGIFEMHFYSGLDNKTKAVLLGFAFNIVSIACDCLYEGQL